MVVPQWGSFQGIHQQTDEQDFSQQDFQPEQSPEQKKASWGSFQSPHTYQGPVDPTAEEDTFGTLVRNWLSFQSRGVEQAVGRAGNVEKFSKDVLTNFPSMGGLLGKGLSMLVGPEKWEQIVRGPKEQQQMIPTSQDIRKVSKGLTKGYTEPKTPNEAKINEFVEDVGATLSGRPVKIPGRTTTQNLLINNLGIPAAANAVKQVVSGLGFGEGAATVSKLGVWTVLSLLGNANATNYASQFYNKAREGIPEYLQMNVPRLLNRLGFVRSKLLSSDPRNSIALKQIADIENDLAKGQSSVHNGMGMFHGVNASKRSKGMYEHGQTDDLEFARNAVDKVKGAVNEEIMEAAAAHPEALENWTNGNQSWAVIQQSKRLTNWIQDKIRGPHGKLIGATALPLFGVSGVSAALKAPLVGGGAAIAGPAIYKAGQVAYRAWKDPRLADYYWKALSAAAAKDLPAFLNNYQKLNKGLEKDLKPRTSFVKVTDKSNKKNSS